MIDSRPPARRTAKPSPPDGSPDRVRATLTRLTGAVDGLGGRLEADPTLERTLVAVLAASRSLGRYLESRPAMIDVLRHLEERPPCDARSADALVAWKRHEFLRIAARDLTGRDDLPATGAALSALAADVLDGAVRLTRTAAPSSAAPFGTGGEPTPEPPEAEEPPEPPGAEEPNGIDSLAIIGMGKLGGNELNYSSDIDVMFVGEGQIDLIERRARDVIAIVRRCFRVDTNLRPQGRDGPLVRSLESFEAYWERWADAWELQALLKARPVAADEGRGRRLGERFAATAQACLWSHPFASEDLRDLRRMKRRSEEMIARQGLADREIKHGRGGIRDIEFTVQLLQLVHGHLDAELRDPNTLTTLDVMASAGYIDPDDARQLADAYRFLRVTEHRLQLEDERQVHTVPDDPEALDRLARVIGFRDRATSAPDQFRQRLVRHQNAVRAIHERVYFRPLLEAFADSSSPLGPEAVATRLTAFGFSDAERTRGAVVELTHGLSRTSRMMQQLLPLILDWLSDAPDPDLGLLTLHSLLSRPERTTQLTEAFRDSPAVAQRLCQILGTSRLLGDILRRHPDLVARLPNEERWQHASLAELAKSASAAIEWRPDPAQRKSGLRRWKERHFLGIAVRDVLGHSDVAQVGAELTTLAEATIETALQSLQPQIAFGVVALGRLGGGELSYVSDLDVIFVFHGGAAEADEAQRIALGLLRFAAGATSADRLYSIDTGLRPEGKQGPLARSLDSYLHYWDRYALVWERQAMIRARPIAGDLALGTHLIEELAPIVWGDGLDDQSAREIRGMKARVERERIPFGEDPLFHLKLGRGSLSDVEFTVQLLQLQHGIRGTATMAALEQLAAEGVLTTEDAELLMSSYRFCERTRNRWFLVNSKGGDSLPSAPDQLLRLSRSLGFSPTGLREEYRRVTRRARRVVERVFYDQD